MANYISPNTRKRVRTNSKLSVRLFLLDPEKEITKATKEIGSEKRIEQLMQKGCGPPRPEHCANNDKGKDKVEFSLELTNEQFKQKIIEIYPKLENACFVFMKAGKDNKLEELNPGRCCFRCYTPDNVYHSERGQGRLYIRKIAENQISQCTHRESAFKRMRAAVGGLRPILPKPVPAVSTSSTVGTEATKNAVTSVAMPTNRQFPVPGNPGIESRVLLLPPDSMAGQDPTSFPNVFSAAESSQPAQSTVNMIPQSQLQSSTVAGTELPPATSSLGMLTKTQLPLSTIVSQIASTPPVYRSANVVPQSQLPSTIYGTESRPLVFNTSATTVTPSTTMVPSITMATFPATPTPSTIVFNADAMTTPGPFLSTSLCQAVPTPTMLPLVNIESPSTTLYSTNAITTPGPSMSSSALSTVPTTTVAPSVTMATFPATPSPSTFISNTESRPPVFSTDAMATQGQSPSFSVSWTLPTTNVVPSVTTDVGSMTMRHQGSNIVPENNFGMSSDILRADVYSGERNEVFSNDQFEPLPFGDVNFQALSTDVRNVLESAPVNFRNQLFRPPFSALPSNGRSLQSSRLHALADVTVERVHIDKFLENVKSTGKLEISLVVVNNDDLLKKLNESTIYIHTVEIHSMCKLEQVLVNYSLPPCLEVLRIRDNTLDEEDIFSLIRSLRNMKGLHELDLCCTKFTESSFSCFITVLIKCSDLRKLCLTDNGLTKQYVNCLITAFESLKNLKHLNLSKNNLTETQANDILQKCGGEGNSIVSLDLVQNALQGNEIIVRICKLDSLEELNLSHNYIRFHPLPSLEGGSDKFPINTKIISLSSSHMTPSDICRFHSLIRSDLLKLNLDFNHVGNSIWSFCSLRIFKHLKVLSLANTDICGPAIEGLADLLSSVTELEELNLSSNNLMLEDFRNLQSSLSNLTQLKKLNLSNNNLDGITEILPSLKYLEELRLSNVHLNGDDCKELFKGFLVPLNKLKHLNLSGNQIDIEIIDDPLLLPPNLQEVILSDIIHGEKLFANMIPLQDQLRKLHLSEIKLRPRDADRLAVMLSSFRLLQELALPEVHVSDRKCEKIFSAIQLLTNLKKLDLGGMKVNNGKAFIEILLSLSFLEEIVFPCVSMHDDGVTGFFDGLRSLRYLKNLSFGSANITQAGAVTLAEVLPSLQLLEKLVFRKIDDECQKHLFDAVRELKCLKELDLGRSEITHTGAVTLAGVLPSLQLLEKLVLGIEFGNECHIQLCYALQELKNIKILNFGWPKITPTASVTLAEVLPSLPLLEELLLAYIESDDKCQKQLFDAVGNLKYLKELNLWWSTITQTGAETLAEVLPSLQLLEKLVLEGIELDDECQKQLFDAVGKLKYLKELHLPQFTFTQTGAVTLAEVLPSLQLLEKLVLIEFNNGCRERLFHAVGKLKYLKELEITQTTITQTDAVALAKALPSLQLLEKLGLSVVKLDKESSKHLFLAVGKLKYLKNLQLAWFMINHTGAVTLASVLPSLQLLEELEFIGIQFDGECQKHLFHAVGKLKYLKELDLRLTAITLAGAATLIDVLPTLRNLSDIWLSKIKSDKNKTSRDAESEENERSKSKLKAAARLVAGLKIGWL